MALFNWDMKYSVGVKMFDDQHKKLFDIINNLFDAMKEGKSKEILGSILDRLLDYTLTHFKDEENVMAKHNYPALDQQKQQHKIFTDKIASLSADHKAGKMVLSIEISNFLKDWLINHIQGIDRQYSEFFNNIGVK